MSPSPLSPHLSTTVISQCTVYPDRPSTLHDLKLSVSDLPMLSCQYIQKGVLLSRPPLSFDALLARLRRSLSHTLSHFPPLAGRFTTDPAGRVHITCNDAGVVFVHANAAGLTLRDLLSPTDVPDAFKEFFTFDGAVSYDGHFRPLAAVQVTELADGVFIGCTVNHAVTDGTSFWNFFNTFAEACKGSAKGISRPPDFSRSFFSDSPAVLRFPPGGPNVSFAGAGPIRERIFSFSREAILELKSRANGWGVVGKKQDAGGIITAEILGKERNDEWKKSSKVAPVGADRRVTEISSFQSLSAQLWRSVTRVRKLPAASDTTFRMAVNCRHRLEPRIDPYYFGNAIQSIPTVASVGELLSRDLNWAAGRLHEKVVAHGDATVRRGVEDWERDPRCFPLGNFDGASITMGSSPRFPMYDNDFGWGRPIAVRSGRANKFDGKISAFPGREGNGSVDLEVCLAPSTMAGLEADAEFMQYVGVVW